MAGGEGSRLRPLTCNRPKPLVPICNKPVMEYALELLRRHGVRTCLVTLHYLADEVMAYFGNGSDWEMRLLYSVEEEPLGTAGSVKRIEEYLTDTFLVLSGDALTDFDLTAAAKFHKERKAMATLVLTRVANPLEFGMIFTDSESRVTRFLEKPSWGEVFSDTINSGIYIVEPEVLKLLEPRKACDFSKDLFPLLLERGMPIYGYVADGYWCDVGNPDQYRQAHLDLLDGRIHHSPPGEQLRDGIWVGSGAQIHPSAKLKGPLVIGRNCRVRDSARLAEYSVIGDNCIIEDGADLERLVVWDNAYIGKKVRAHGSIICRSVTCNANVTIPEGAVVGDNVYIGRGASLQPDVKIWPDKNVEAGASVSLSLVWGKKWPGSLFGEDGISGLGNIEITPEYALKLGAAYGALLHKGAVVVMSRDGHPASRMTTRALMCGLVSVGINVRDLQVLPSAVGRNALKNSADAFGGMHCRVKSEDPRSLVLEFFDSQGITIDRTWERKIENRFFREDFRRTPMDEVGTIDFPARTVDQYLDGFTSNLRVDLIRQAHFRVVIDYAYGTSCLALPSILSKLGCEVVSLNAYIDAERSREQLIDSGRALQQLVSIVSTLKADLGIYFDPTGERLTLVDDQGQVIQGARLLALFALLVFRQTKEALIAVPVVAPSVVEELAQKSGGKVIWTRTDSRTLTYTATLGEARFAFAGGIRGDFVFPGFSPGFDAMFAFARLLEMIALEDKPLSALEEWIPSFCLESFAVDCSWQAKGRVMRLLFEEVGHHKVELVDGLKVWDAGGWVLILPDRSEPLLEVWVYSESAEQSKKLKETYRALVERVSSLAAEAPVARPLRSREATAAPQATAEDRAFHFWVPGRYLGVRACSLKEFVDVLHYIDPASLRYHFERGDFANWVGGQLKELELAEGIRAVRLETQDGEDLRGALLGVFSKNTESQPVSA